MQINSAELGLPSLHGNRAYLFPVYRLPVNRILGYVCFIVNSVLLKSLLCLCGNQEVNGYNTAGARRGTERLSRPLAVTATHDVGAGGSESAKDLLNSSCLLLVNLHLDRQQTERNSFPILSTANIFFFLFAYENGKSFAFIISTLKKIIVQYSSIECNGPQECSWQADLW